MANRELISWVRGVQVVTTEEGAFYLLAWGENASSIEGCPELRPRPDSPCEFDFLAEPGPLPVITPAAAITRLPEEICLRICVHGQNGPVCIPWAKAK